MKICFVALSRKRKRYFNLIAAHAPDTVSSIVVFGVTFCPSLFFACFSRAPHSPDADIQVHLKRQRRNYPRLFRYSWLARLNVLVLTKLEILRFRFYRDFLLRHSVDAVAIWNGQKIPYTAVVHAARDLSLPVWYFENGVLPGTTTLDRAGVNALSCVPREASFYRDYVCRTLLAGDSSVGERDCRQFTKAGGGFDILVPLQVESDTQVILHSDWVGGNADLVGVVSSAIKQLGLSRCVRVVVRPHPLARSSFDSGGLPDFVVVDAVTPLSKQLANADLVVTINSTVGLECLLVGGSVLVLGRALYSVPGVVQMPGDMTSLKVCIENVIAGAWSAPGRAAFLHFLRERYCIAGDWRTHSQLGAEHWKSVWLRLLEGDLLARELALLGDEGNQE